MRKSTAFWMALAGFAFGALWGFLLAPIKQGITIYACYNGSGDKENGNVYHFIPENEAGQ